MCPKHTNSNATARREKVTISLLSPVVCVIVECESGYRWCVQAACISTQAREAEGICIPILPTSTCQLRLFSCRGDYRVWGPRDFGELNEHQREEFIAEAQLWILYMAELCQEPLELDESRLAPDAAEAWLPVKIGSMGEFEEEFSPLYHFQGQTGWLHWPNCD